MLGICYLICAGDRTKLEFTPTAGDLIIAVDGGLRYTEQVGLAPDLCIGDFDSLGFQPKDKSVIKLDPIKDVTDTFAAVEVGLRRGYTAFQLHCALGGRLSHTLANIQTLSYLAQQGASGKIVGDGTELFVVSRQTEFDAGGYLSLFPLNGDARVKISGCKYSGEFSLTPYDSLGVSNEPLANARVEVLRGEVLAVIEK